MKMKKRWQEQRRQEQKKLSIEKLFDRREDEEMLEVGYSYWMIWVWSHLQSSHLKDTLDAADVIQNKLMPLDELLNHNTSIRRSHTLFISFF